MGSFIAHIARTPWSTTSGVRVLLTDFMPEQCTTTLQTICKSLKKMVNYKPQNQPANKEIKVRQCDELSLLSFSTHCCDASVKKVKHLNLVPNKLTRIKLPHEEIMEKMFWTLALREIHMKFKLSWGCRWKWRMIIAVNFPVQAIGRNKSEKYQCFNSVAPTQLVEHRTSIVEVTGLNPIEALIFFRLLPSNCLNRKIYCEDHSLLSLALRSDVISSRWKFIPLISLNLIKTKF